MVGKLTGRISHFGAACKHAEPDVVQVDTEGPMAIDQFYVTYHGDPLPPPMVTLLTNSLQYQLSLAEVSKEESY